MNQWIKRGLISVSLVAAIGLSTLGAAALHGESKMKRTLHLPDYAIPLRDDAASIEHGKYLFQTKGCADCHADSGAGRAFINDPETGMRVVAPNISPGSGSVVSHYNAADWERTIRHGVKPTGEPIMIMPSEEYARFSDQDLIDLVAYTRHLPPAAGGSAVLDLPVMVRALYGLGVVQDAAEKIDHTLAPHPPMQAERSKEYGAYLGESCKGCHGP
ncbi:MAG TPA: c-type cytochrome, partial [Pseudomonadales bacterium]|nr:c-type cytochrome [Pseudomonadales bacterium]